MLTIKIWVLWEFRGSTPDGGATLVVALVWAGTRPAPSFGDTPQNPKDPKFVQHRPLPGGTGAAVR